jgi:flagellar motor component MotA
MDETISTSLVSTVLGIVIGVAIEASMPSYRVSGASTAELAFESAVQIAMLSVVLGSVVPWRTLVSTNGIPFGMALVAAQPELILKLSRLAVEARKSGTVALQRMAQPVAVAPTATP